MSEDRFFSIKTCSGESLPECVSGGSAIVSGCNSEIPLAECVKATVYLLLLHGKKAKSYFLINLALDLAKATGTPIDQETIHEVKTF